MMNETNNLGSTSWSARDAVRLRAHRGDSDMPLIVDIMNDSYRTDGLDVVETVEHFAGFLSNPTGFDIAQDLRIAEVDGVAVAFARVRSETRNNGERVYWQSAHVRGAWRNRGVGTLMQTWLNDRARERRSVESPDAKSFAHVWSAEKTLTKIRLLEKFGFAPARYSFEMSRPSLDDIAEFELPDDLEIKPITPGMMRAVWEADIEGFRDDWGFSEPSEGDYQRWLANTHTQPLLFKVAFDKRTGEVVGMVRNFIDAAENEEFSRRRGYTEGISTRREYRKRGVARALLCESLRMLKALGMTEATLGVDADNPTGALRVYEACGFRVTKREMTYRLEL